MAEVVTRPTASSLEGSGPPEAAPPAPAAAAAAPGEGEEEDVVFDASGDVAMSKPLTAAEEEADMFAEDDAFEQRALAGGGVEGLAPQSVAAADGLADGWDDVEGYYKARVGEVLDGRYEVFATHGAGVFSSVLRTRDLAEGGGGGEVAIKVIRANETMHKAAQLEVTILNKLAGADPENRRHVVRLLRTFEFRNHMFLCFESLALNLRQVLRKFGRNVGLNVSAVHAYATQLLIALKHLRNCGIIHADVKPDNILVSERHNLLKLCDFGSAMFDGDNEITPYLVSRFYRAPEVILGLPYSHPIDMWAVGCVLFELYTGSIAFAGRSNNEMLKLMIETKGPFPKKMLKRALFRERHFDAEFTFGLLEEDPITKRDVRRLMRDSKPTRTVEQALGRGAGALAEADRKRGALLADLLDKMLALDPEKRITVAQALVHPFVKEERRA